MEITKQIDLFRERNGWVKSDLELSMEALGYKLFSNFQHGFFSRLDIMKGIHRFQKGLATEFERKEEAYDFLSFRLVEGESFYIPAKELIIPARVVIRNQTTLRDIPYDKDVTELLSHIGEVKSMEGVR